jgi:protein-disulfide isomerase
MHLKIPVSERDQQQGNKKAPIILVEYGDYECPYCGQAYPVIKQLQQHFKDNLLFVFRNFPLAEIHPHAQTAAQVAEASGLQGRFWPVHDLIFENQEDLSHRQLAAYARSAGVDLEKLSMDMNTRNILNKIEQDMDGGIRSGVNGTPTFFINGSRHDADHTFNALKIAMEQHL